MATQNAWYQNDRLGGLRRFAVSLTVFNLLGHTVLGFEQSWAQPLVGLAAAYAMELVLELLEAWSNGRPLRFRNARQLVDFLLSAHISGLAVSMLLYANETLLPIAFAAATAIAGKALLRAPSGGSVRHYMNPSNFGITVTLLAFPWVGIAPPYMFTENLDAWGNLALVGLIVVLGTMINARYTRRLPLIATWVGGFVLQAALRHWWLDASFTGALVPMSGIAFLLFSFYMVTDPATTPATLRGQLAFGGAMAAAYGLLVALDVVFGLFFGLTLVCGVRGLSLHARSLLTQRRVERGVPVAGRGALPRPVAEGAGLEYGSAVGGGGA
jgi:hypothetical protein